MRADGKQQQLDAKPVPTFRGSRSRGASSPTWNHSSEPADMNVIFVLVLCPVYTSSAHMAGRKYDSSAYNSTLSAQVRTSFAEIEIDASFFGTASRNHRQK